MDDRERSRRELRGRVDAFQVLRAQGLVVRAVEDLVVAFRAHEPASPLPLRRAVQEFVRLPVRTRLLQLASLSVNPKTSAVALRLTRLALIMSLVARRLGIAPGMARDLAAAAALSGIGRAAGDELVFADPETCEACSVHVDGIRWTEVASGDGPAAALRVIASHGQKAHVTRRAGHPLVRLVAVVDRYERLRAPAPGGQGLRPDEAMRQLGTEPDLETSCIDALAAAIGIFPVGSPVRLSTGEVGVVVDVPKHPAKLRQPQVLVVKEDGTREILDLSARNVSVSDTLEKSQLQLNMKDFLFA